MRLHEWLSVNVDVLPNENTDDDGQVELPNNIEDQRQRLGRRSQGCNVSIAYGCDADKAKVVKGIAWKVIHELEGGRIKHMGNFEKNSTQNPQIHKAEDGP